MSNLYVNFNYAIFQFRFVGCYHLTLLKVIVVSHLQRKLAYTIKKKRRVKTILTLSGLDFFTIFVIVTFAVLELTQLSLQQSSLCHTFVESRFCRFHRVSRVCFQSKTLVCNKVSSQNLFHWSGTTPTRAPVRG